MAAVETQVLVVGAGPVGLTLATILGMHGVRTMLVERNASTVAEPRAVSICRGGDLTDRRFHGPSVK